MPTTDTSLQGTEAPQIYPQLHTTTTDNTLIMTTMGNKDIITMTGGIKNTTGRKGIKEGICKMHKMQIVIM